MSANYYYLKDKLIDTHLLASWVK